MTESQVFVLVLGSAGVLMAVGGGLSLARQFASSSWKSVEGTIVSARVERSPGGERDDFGAVVEYEYVVDDQVYYSRRRHLVNSTEQYLSAASAKRILQPYTKGRTVTVWYDPGDPRSATLHRDRGSLIPFAVTFLGFVFFAAALVVHVYQIPL